MNTDIALLISDAKEWLEAQLPAEQGSERWYSLGNFRSFVSEIEADSSPQSIERASWALSRHISDQLEWSAEHCKIISSFLERARRIRKATQDA
jgi:hypothetical protein